MHPPFRNNRSWTRQTVLTCCIVLVVLRTLFPAVGIDDVRYLQLSIDSLQQYSVVFSSDETRCHTNKGIEQSSTLHPLSAAALVARNVSSMFELSPEAWPTIDNNKVRCPIDGFSIYVYDQLPSHLSTDLEDQVRLFAHKRLAVQENIATEWALVQLFRTSPCRTWDPHSATFLVVPYMHWAHCALNEGYSHLACSQVPDAEVDALYKALPFYKQHKLKHLYIQVHADPLLKQAITAQTWRLVVGPTEQDRPGAMVMPLFNDDPKYQPSVLHQQLKDLRHQKRKYSFVSFYASVNKRMSGRKPRRFRRYFSRTVKADLMKLNGTGIPDYDNYTFAGKPFLVSDWSDNQLRLQQQHSQIDIMATYRDSILCPVLPGDGCWQRRFFDVIRSGCLPVVLEWQLPPKGFDHNRKSWHTLQSACSIEEAYPFAERLNQDSNLTIDYKSFVVTAPGNPTDETNVTSLLTAMESVLNSPAELAERQTKMIDYATRLTFGLGADAHRYNDAFMQTLLTLHAHSKSNRYPA